MSDLLSTIGRCPVCGQQKWSNDGQPCFACSKSLLAALAAQRALVAELKAALEFYADDENHERPPAWCNCGAEWWLDSDIHADGGKRARAALGRVGSET